jgi:iron complex outermembrane receptor protein
MGNFIVKGRATAMKAVKVFLAVCITVFLLSSAVMAEEKKTEEGFEAYSLGDVYVKEGKVPLTEQTSITNVITAEDIKATSSRTVAEALGFAPGVRVSTSVKNQPNVAIHGFFDQNRVLVLIDGVPYYETYFGFLDLNQFTTDNVAKIEVIKGAASVLYGTNAEGGVINIITKQATGKPFFGVTAEGGQVDYYKASVSHGMKKGIFSYWLNYDHAQQHGWRMSDDFTPRIGTIVRKPGTPSQGIFEDGGTRNQSNSESNSFWAKFGIEPSAGSEYFINFHYISKDYGIPPSITTVNLFPAGASGPFFSNFMRYNRYDDWGIDLSGQQKVTDKLSLSGKVFYHNHADGLYPYDDWTYSNIGARSNYYDYTIGGALITQFQPVQWNTMRLAFNYRGDAHKQRADNYTPFEHFFSLTGSVGLEDELNVAKNFSVVVGGSFDWFKVTEANRNIFDSTANFLYQSPLPTGPSTNSFNPMIGATYLFPDNTKLFASVARKTRFPTLRQLFDSRAGNIDLKPEIAINSTVGVSRSFSNFMWSELAFFYHDISDFIMQVQPQAKSPFINIGRIQIYGIETNTEFYPMKDLVLKLAYNFNNATDQSDNRVTDKVINVPEHKLDMGAQYTLPYTKTRLDLNGILYGQVYNQLPTPSSPNQQIATTAGYFVLNARVSQKFLKNFEAYMAFNNIFDRNYYAQGGLPYQSGSLPGAPEILAPGRNIFGGVTATF